MDTEIFSRTCIIPDKVLKFSFRDFCGAKKNFLVANCLSPNAINTSGKNVHRGGALPKESG